MKQEDIQITGAPTTDPYVCQFTVNHPLCLDSSITCDSAETAKGSPLLEALFAIEGIREVLVFGSTLTVAKSSDTEWPALGKQIGAAIREQITSGKQLISQELKERAPSENELKKKAEEVLEAEINPYVASHGGKIEVVDVKGTTLYVNLSGGCQGCASAKSTLKQGVESILFERIPQLKEVVDMTDHGLGANPYYQ